MVPRLSSAKILQLATQFRVVAVIGPRQSGKTTVVRAAFPGKPYVSLETPINRSFAIEDPLGFLQTYPDGAVLDEIQRAPELLSWLQQNVDEDPRPGKFILTGSNNFLLLAQITQSLAGRVAFVEQLPFSLPELTAVSDALADLDTLIWKGGYPAVQAQAISPLDWLPAYLRTYVERDVRQIRNVGNLLAFERVLSLCAGRVGQELNLSNIAVEAGVDYKTVQAWIGILQASYIIWLLPPWHQNFNKRIVKTPKLYFWDTGLACSLLRISGPEMLRQHPWRGALFENLMLNELQKARFNRGQRSNLYFFKESSGNEVDVIADQGTYQLPIELKSGATPSSDWWKGLRWWKTLTGQRDIPGRVIYGGDTTQLRSEGHLLSWRECGKQDFFDFAQ